MTRITKNSKTSNVVGVWRKCPKGPILNKKELDHIRKRVVSGGNLNQKESRRLLQTLDSCQTGIIHGVVEDFPPLFSKVYQVGGHGDVFEGTVIKHLSSGSIKVRLRVVFDEPPPKEVWQTWQKTPVWL